MTYQPPPPDAGSDAAAALRRHGREIAAAVGLAMQGKINAVIATFTLTAGVTSTVMSDPRLTVGSVVLFDPLTANAAAELAAGTLYALTAGRNNAAWTFTHANAGSTDRSFRALIIG